MLEQPSAEPAIYFLPLFSYGEHRHTIGPAFHCEGRNPRRLPGTGDLPSRLRASHRIQGRQRVSPPELPYACRRMEVNFHAPTGRPSACRRGASPVPRRDHCGTGAHTLGLAALGPSLRPRCPQWMPRAFLLFFSPLRCHAAPTHHRPSDIRNTVDFGLPFFVHARAKVVRRRGGRPSLLTVDASADRWRATAARRRSPRCCDYVTGANGLRQNMHSIPPSRSTDFLT